jgi:hypothetical protein
VENINQESVLEEMDQECGGLEMSCSSSCANFGNLMDADRGIYSLTLIYKLI